MNRTIEVSAETVDNLVKDTIRDDLFSLRKDMNNIRLRITAGEKVPDYQLEDMKDWKRWHDALMIITEYYFSHEERKQFEIGPEGNVEDSAGF